MNILKKSFYILVSLTLIALIGCKNANKDKTEQSTVVKEHSASPLEVTSGMATDGNVSIEYFTQGSGIPFVLLPGGSLNVEYLVPFANSLAKKGYQVVRVNPRGTGNSKGPTDIVTMHDLGNDIFLVIQKLGLKNVNIAGHAFGNRIARVVANDHPEAIHSIILLAAGGTIPPKDEALNALNTIFDPKATNDEVLATMKYMVGDSTYYDSTWKLVKKSRSPQAAGIQSLAMESTPISDWNAPKGDAPFLIIQGSVDQIAPPANGELIKKKFPERTTMVYIQGAGHTMILERAAEVADDIVEFLKEHK